MSHAAGKAVMEEIERAEIRSPYFFSGEYLVVILRHVRRNAVFYRAYFSSVGMAGVEKGYQTLFETVFKPYFRQLGMESEHQMEYIFRLSRRAFSPWCASGSCTAARRRRRRWRGSFCR